MRLPLVVTDQVPEIVRRFPAVPAVAPYDAEGFRLLPQLVTPLLAEPSHIDTAMSEDELAGQVTQAFGL